MKTKNSISIDVDVNDPPFSGLSMPETENYRPRPLRKLPYTATIFDRVLKRSFDILLSLLMGVIFAPIFLTISAYIMTVYRVSPVFCHTRIGLDGKRFDCYKLRTMIPDADAHLARILATDPIRRDEWMKNRKLKDDPRVLPGIGEILRKASLAELPQIFNVLLGQMSMVGPRPVVESELINYGPYLTHYTSVRPGITGAWQIGGRSGTSYAERVAMDVWYIENANFFLDLRIFFKTAFSFCSGRLSGGF